MKPLTYHLFEKLIINKNFKVSELDDLLDIDFFRDNDRNGIYGADALQTHEEGVIKIIHEFIKSNYIHKIPSRIDLVKLNSEDINYNMYFACINPYSNEVIIFHKHGENSYDKFSIWYKFKQFTNEFENCSFLHYTDELDGGIYPLRNNTTFSKNGHGELYQISKETYNEINEIFNKLYKKCKH